MAYQGNRRASDREFPPFSVMIGGKRTTIKKIRCATPDCNTEAELIDHTRTGMACDVVTRKFGQKGWEIGANEKHDFCPECVAKQLTERRSRRFKAANLKLVEPAASPAGESPMPTAETPATMSRDDRRVIFTKLNEVYLDEARGYEAPWTDKKVAENLGTPQAWVAEVRERDFGPARDNGEIRDLLEKVKAVGADVKQYIEEGKAIRADGAALVERVNTLNRSLLEANKKLDGLLAVADRIERSSC